MAVEKEEEKKKKKRQPFKRRHNGDISYYDEIIFINIFILVNLPVLYAGFKIHQ